VATMALMPGGSTVGCFEEHVLHPWWEAAILTQLRCNAPAFNAESCKVRKASQRNVIGRRRQQGRLLGEIVA